MGKPLSQKNLIPAKVRFKAQVGPMQDIVKNLYINGQWVPAEKKKTYELRSPSTGEVIAHVADGGTADVKKAIDAASDAFSSVGKYAR